MYHHHRVVFRVYKAWASSDVCHSCVTFRANNSFTKFEARSTQAVNTANRLCYSHKWTLSRQALHARCSLGVCIGVRHHDTKYTARNMAAISYIKSATGRTLHYTRYANVRLEIHYDALCKSATGITRHYPLVLKSVTGNKRHHTWYGKMLPVYIQTIEKKPP